MRKGSPQTKSYLTRQLVVSNNEISLREVTKPLTAPKLY